ncbi:YcgL domain-containing protein [Billgrantia endophytica]|uniref:YcgL domain-containing protein C1H69_21700 n=1 Tax=Billgrantia endophytica TaxID=2033802 RepID=A0A2N7TVQ4_9GAMM|nr:YcgL domain-containing protein [Halomonas endophytica]PMR72273.1 hypothetical protein C1H69_21700 [Halomonas endophytica]
MNDDRMRGNKLLCEIFRSPRKEEMYLYVDKRRGLADVPDALLERFGKPVPTMTLILTPERTMARAKAADVIESIRDKGYYFQMPPAKEEYLMDLYRTPPDARY